MPEFEGQEFSVPSQGLTRPYASPLTALEVYQRIQERQSREVSISTNEAIVALTGRVDILEQQLAQRNRIPKIAMRLSQFLTPQLRDEAILWGKRGALLIGEAIGGAGICTLSQEIWLANGADFGSSVINTIPLVPLIWGFSIYTMSRWKRTPHSNSNPGLSTPNLNSNSSIDSRVGFIG